MKLKNSLLAVLVATVGAANAGSIAATNISAIAGDTVVAIDNTVLSSGVAVSGYFTSGYDPAADLLAMDYATVLSNFNPLATGQIGSTSGTLGVDVNGFYDSFVDYGAPATDPYLGAVLYTFYGDGASLGASTYLGLASFGETVGPDTPTPDGNALVLNGSATVLLGSFGATTMDLSGVLGPGAEDTGVATFNLVNTVPEPSVVLLGGLGMLGLIRRRR